MSLWKFSKTLKLDDLTSGTKVQDFVRKCKIFFFSMDENFLKKEKFELIFISFKCFFLFCNSDLLKAELLNAWKKAACEKCRLFQRPPVREKLNAAFRKGRHVKKAACKKGRFFYAAFRLFLCRLSPFSQAYFAYSTFNFFKNRISRIGEVGLWKRRNWPVKKAKVA